MSMTRQTLSLSVVLLLTPFSTSLAERNAAPAVEVLSLATFDDGDASLKPWSPRSDSSIALESSFATEGSHSLQLTFSGWEEGVNPWPGVTLDLAGDSKEGADWTPYDQLVFDVHNASDWPAQLRCSLSDADGNRMRSFTLELDVAETRQVSLPMRRARLTGDPEKPLDLERVTALTFDRRAAEVDNTFHIDNLRLKAAEPDLDSIAFAPDPFERGHLSLFGNLPRPFDFAIEVVDAENDRVVHRDRRANRRRLFWQWDGRVDGQPLPPGDYRLLLHATDAVRAPGRPYTRKIGEFRIRPENSGPETPSLAAWFAPSTDKIMLHDRPETDQPVYRTRPPNGEALFPEAAEPLRIDMARNAHQAAQVVFLAGEEPVEIQVALGELTHVDSGADFNPAQSKIHQVGYIKTREPGLYQVDFSGWWPDPLLSPETMIASPGEAMPVWVSLKALPETEPGLYRGSLTVGAGGRSGSLPLEVRVYDVTLPSETTIATAFQFSERRAENLHGDAWSDELRDRYFDFLAGHRLEPDNIYRSSPPPVEWVERHAASGRLRNFNTIYASEDRANEEELDRLMRELDPFVEALRDRGLMDHAYLYGFDEVSPPGFEAMKTFLGHLKDRYPDLRTMTTAYDRTYGTTNGLDEVVDIWVPLTDAYHPKVAETARAKGQEVWWYICIVPDRPHANWFLESPALEARLLWWMTYHYRVDGFLYWATNHWNNQVERGPLRVDGHNKTNWNPVTFRTANGDGNLFYADEHGPVPSIRLANIRDGIQDYELLRLLETRLDDGGDQSRNLTGHLVRSLTDFSHDPDEFRNVRRQLLEKLESL